MFTVGFLSRFMEYGGFIAACSLPVSGSWGGLVVTDEGSGMELLVFIFCSGVSSAGGAVVSRGEFGLIIVGSSVGVTRGEIGLINLGTFAGVTLIGETGSEACSASEGVMDYESV